MKTQRVFLCVMLLPLLVSLEWRSYAQSIKNPQRDLAITMSQAPEPTELGAVFGTLKNISANNYNCVLLEFNLSTRYDLRRAGEQSRLLGVLSVEVRNLPPGVQRQFFRPLPYPAGSGLKSINDCSEQSSNQSVVIYENTSFEGRSMAFGIGRHRLFNVEDFNDLASSIKVPSGLVAVVYEHADEVGGYGVWVDLLEDHPDLRKYNFDKKISYLDVFSRQKVTSASGSNPGATFVYVRNRIANGLFVPGNWKGVGAHGSDENSNPVPGPAVAPRPPKILTFTATPARIKKGAIAELQWNTRNTQAVFLGEPNPLTTSSEPIGSPRVVDLVGSLQVSPSRTTTYRLQAKHAGLSMFQDVKVQVINPPPPLSFCTIKVQIDRDKSEYSTYVQLLHADGSPTRKVPRKLGLGNFSFVNVPEGRYKVIVKGNYPLGEGRSGGLAPFLLSDEIVVCSPNGSPMAHFAIRSTEG